VRVDRLAHNDTMQLDHAEAAAARNTRHAIRAAAMKKGGSMSIAKLPCSKCGRPRIIPQGSNQPRCQVCEPKQLWLDAEKAWNNAAEKW
jgi:hypothetical protein